jgi:hypothetical protein
MAGRSITGTAEKVNSYTDIRTAADELLRYVSYVSLSESLEAKSGLSAGTSGDDVSSGRLCELLLGSGQPIPDYALMQKKLSEIPPNAIDFITGKPTGAEIRTSFYRPAITSTNATLQNKVISTAYHSAQGKVDFSASFSDISALFCSLIPPTEMALCVPYFDVKIIYVQESSGIGQLSALKFVGHRPNKITGEKNSSNSILQGYTSKDPIVKAGYDVAGMEIFCLPATLGQQSGQLNSEESLQERGVYALDTLSPLLSIESANIQQIGLDGSLYAQTKMDLKMVLHDRSRLSEVSALVSSEIFPTVSFRITYGWSHPDTNKMTGGVYAKLLNSMRVTQDFVVSSARVASKDALSLSLDVSLVSRGSQGLSGAKVITAGGEYIPFTVLLSLVKQFLGLKTSSANNPTVSFEKIGSTIVSYSSPGASKNNYIKISDYYDLFDKILGTVGKDTIAANADIQAISDKLNSLQTNGGTYTPTADDFNGVLEFKYSDPCIFSFGENLNDTFNYREELGLTPDNYIVKRVYDIALESKLANWGQAYESAPIVPLSAAVAKLVAKPLLLSNPDVDEVRIHCFSFSSACGEMAEENIGNFPIVLEQLKPRQIDKQEIEGLTARSSANSALKFIMRQANDPASPFFGLNRELTARSDIKKKYAALTGSEAEAAQAQMDQELDANQDLINSKNRLILESKLINFVESSFVPARIKYQIDILDCTTEDSNSASIPPVSNARQKKIARIMIYDEKAGAFNKLANLLFSMINSNGMAQVSRSGASIPEASLALSNVSSIREFLQVMDTKNIGSNDVITYALSNKVRARQIMSNAYPVLAIGSDSSMIKNASFSSQPSGEVQSSYLLTALKGTGGSKQGDNPNSALLDDVLIIPTTVTISMLGNVLMARGQTYFVDFNTGTTLDNSYTVTSVSHNIRQGTFETSAVLAPTNSVSMRSTSRQLEELATLVKNSAGKRVD